MIRTSSYQKVMSTFVFRVKGGDTVLTLFYLAQCVPMQGSAQCLDWIQLFSFFRQACDWRAKKRATALFLANGQINFFENHYKSYAIRYSR